MSLIATSKTLLCTQDKTIEAGEFFVDFIIDSYL